MKSNKPTISEVKEKKSLDYQKSQEICKRIDSRLRTAKRKYQGYERLSSLRLSKLKKAF